TVAGRSSSPKRVCLKRIAFTPTHIVRDRKNLWTRRTLQGCLLNLEQTHDAKVGEIHHCVHLLAGERLAFGAALHFDELVPGVHHDVEIDVSGSVFAVVEVESGLPGDHSDADRSD